jgi:uncharacterized protein
MPRTRLLLPAIVVLGLCAGSDRAMADTLLRLAETATVAVRPDQIVAQLRAEATAANAAEAQQKVNATMAAAVARARQATGVTVNTGSYNVWRGPVVSGSANTDRAMRWQANQTLELTGSDGTQMLTLADALQQSGMATKYLGWRLAPDTTRDARRRATEAAVKALRGRAEEVAGLLGLRFVEFREVRLDNVRPMPMARMMAAAAPMAAGGAPPVAEAEDINVEATVEADAVLAPR